MPASELAETEHGLEYGLQHRSARATCRRVYTTIRTMRYTTYTINTKKLLLSRKSCSTFPIDQYFRSFAPVIKTTLRCSPSKPLRRTALQHSEQHTHMDMLSPNTAEMSSNVS